MLNVLVLMYRMTKCTIYRLFRRMGLGKIKRVGDVVKVNRVIEGRGLRMMLIAVVTMIVISMGE